MKGGTRIAYRSSARSAGIAALTALLSLLPLFLLLRGVQWAAWWHDLGGGHLAFLGTTLLSGIIALAIVVALGVPTAWYLVSVAPIWFQRLALVLVLIPLLMPPLVLGLTLAFVLGPGSPVGTALAAAGINSINSWFALVIAQVYEALPYFVITLWSGFRALSGPAEEAALSAGRTPWSYFWYAMLPLSKPALIAALSMAWARVTGAFGAVIVLAYHPVALPVGIWITLQEFGLPQALPLALWLVLIGLPLPLGIALGRSGHVQLLR